MEDDVLALGRGFPTKANPRLSGFLRGLHGVHQPNLQLDWGVEASRYRTSRDLFAALLRTLAAQELSRLAGKGSYFSLLPALSRSSLLRAELMRLLCDENSAKELGLGKNADELLTTLEKSLRVSVLLTHAHTLDPASEFCDFLESRKDLLERNWPQAEKMLRRLAESETASIRDLARTDFLALLLETRRFGELQSLFDQNATTPSISSFELLRGLALLLLNKEAQALESFTRLERNIQSEPAARQNIRNFLRHHQGPSIRLLQRSRELRAKLYELSPSLFSARVRESLRRPIGLSAHRLQHGIDLIEKRDGSNPFGSLCEKARSFLGADLILCLKKGNSGAWKMIGVAGQDLFLEQTQKNSEAWIEKNQKQFEEIWNESRVSEQSFSEKDAKNLALAKSLSRSQWIFPLGDREKSQPAICIVESAHLLQLLPEERFFISQALDQKLVTPGSVENAKTATRSVSHEPKTEKSRLDAFPEFCQRRFGASADLRFAARSLSAILPDLVMAAGSKAPILLQGETGSGKEILSRYIHFESAFREGPFVPFNCNAVPADLFESELFGHKKGSFTGAERERTGLFELANGGTLLLDEIGDFKLELQGKLLRVLQEGVFRRVGENEEIRFNGRIVAATHRDLRKAIERGEFREDLFHRLTRFVFEIPPLRQRREEILPLAAFLLRRFAQEENRSEVELSEPAQALLWRCNWAGNVRALENFLYKLSVFYAGEKVSETELQELAKKAGLEFPEKINSRDANAAILQSAFDSVSRFNDKPNLSQAAQLLGWDRGTLRDKMKEFQLEGI